MRRFVLCAAVALLLCGCDGRYKTISEDSTRKDYVDLQSIPLSDNVIDYISEDKDKGLKHINRTEVDCKLKKMRIVHIKLYKNDVLIFDPPELDRRKLSWGEAVQPGTVGYGIVAAFCDRKK